MSKDDDRRPDWVPDGVGDGFASRIRKGVQGRHDGHDGESSSSDSRSGVGPRRRDLSVDDHVRGVRGGDRAILARSITLVESNLPVHQEKAKRLLTELLPDCGLSIRIGVTGVPGAGKSTFIDSLGTFLLDQGKKVAVLAVDPSSSLTGGSILGDKTRMERLAQDPRCFIRPSPSGGNLGGVARKSRETILLCEAAGYDVVLIETVGVGQSEITVRSMVDFFLLMLIAGAGDELQGIKRGVMELADGILINKADGDNLNRANAARVEFERAVHYLLPATRGWNTRVSTCSAIEEEGIEQTWETIEEFRRSTLRTGVFEARRKEQTLAWMGALLEEYLLSKFYSHPGVKANRASVEGAVALGEITATEGALQLADLFENGKK